MIVSRDISVFLCDSARLQTLRVIALYWLSVVITGVALKRASANLKINQNVEE